ncbi:MAG: dihydropyrimidinase [Candidatus Riflebacteria bacterium]|nr:dihydropyrimidinase [Candidatus Riflebacteria bacterium]
MAKQVAKKSPSIGKTSAKGLAKAEWLLIKGGSIFTASESFSGDILINRGKICAVGENLDFGGPAEIIDAKGLEVYPGGVDAHTHFSLPFMGTVSADDFETGTKAAACGGTTTIIDFAIPARGQNVSKAVEAWHQKAQGKAVVDYGFHVALVEANEKVLAEIPKLVKDGITSFKCFLAYKEALMIDDAQFLEVLFAAKKHKALVSVHAENGDMLSWLMKKLTDAGKTGPQYHPVAHPALAEGEATHRAIVLAKMAEVPLYIVHMSCYEALQEVISARLSGQMVFAETCPQYLLLSDELYQKSGFEPAKWVMSPPLRHVSNQQPLWEGLSDGFIQTVATDHCSFRFKGQKDMGKGNFLKIPNGIPAVGDRINLLYTYGVTQGRMTRNQFAAAIATNPAKLFGLYPRKGSIVPGADADLVIIDPKKKGKISAKTTHHNVDYSAFEGFELKGLPVYVISRGDLIAKDDKFIGGSGRGVYLKRKTFDPGEWGVQKG